jgi:hypothetical protein
VTYLADSDSRPAPSVMFIAMTIRVSYGEKRGGSYGILQRQEAAVMMRHNSATSFLVTLNPSAGFPAGDGDCSRYGDRCRELGSDIVSAENSHELIFRQAVFGSAARSLPPRILQAGLGRRLTRRADVSQKAELHASVESRFPSLQ